jgi:hypothetical protein
MSKAKVGILYVHGIGTQGHNFADRDIALIKKALGKHARDVAFSSYCWQLLIEPQERELIQKNPQVRWKFLRKLLASYGGDALCYQPRHGVDSFYKQAHAGLDDALLRLAYDMEPDGVLVIVAHSLGTIIVNNFIWDYQNSDSVGAAAYNPLSHTLDRLRGLYTFGSPMAIWSMRYPNGGKPIQLPNDCVWRNIYSPADIIGWPIKNINNDYAKIGKLSDIRMWVGGLFSRWNPFSHLAYSRSKKIVKMIADDVIQQIRQFPPS